VINNFHLYFIITTVIKLRKMRWPGNITRRGDMRNAYTILVRKSFVRPRRRRECKIGIDLREICSEGMDRIPLAQDKDQ